MTSLALVAAYVVPAGPAFAAEDAVSSEDRAAAEAAASAPQAEESSWWTDLFAGDGPDLADAPLTKAPTVADREHLPPGQAAEPVERTGEIPGLRSVNTRTFAMSDGTQQVEISSTPEAFETSDGSFADIDPTVRAVDEAAGGAAGPSAKSADQAASAAKADGFAFGNTSNVARSWFGTSADALVRVEAAAGAGTGGVTVGLVGADDLATPVVDGATVTYEDVEALAGGDLVYEVGPGTLKERIVLDEAPKKPVAFEFLLDVDPGLTPRVDEDGSIGFYGEGVDPVLTMPPGLMWDSATADEGKAVAADAVERAVSEDIAYDLAKSGDDWVLTVTPDHKWLSSKDRVAPLTIDPTIVIAPTPTTSRDTFVLSTSPTSNYSNSNRMSVGRTATGVARGLITFEDLLNLVPAGTDLRSASLELYFDQAQTEYATNVALEAHRATGPWVSGTATWNNTSGLVGELSGTQIIVDDGDAGTTSATGSWPTSTNSTFVQYAVGNDYKYNKDTVAGGKYAWQPNLPVAGDWRVDVHHVPGTDRSSSVPVAVNFNGGTKNYTVDQRRGSQGVWTTLGTHPFAAGTAGKVVMSDTPASGTVAVIADAVRFTHGSTVVKPAGQLQQWHKFDVTDTVQKWIDGTAANHGFVLTGADESSNGPIGGPRYETAEYAFDGEHRNRPKLVLTYGRPGVELSAPSTIHSTGAELAWGAYADPSTGAADDLVEYQVHRSIYQTFTPSASTLVAPVAPGTTSFTDTTAVPTPAESTDPFGRAYYYLVAVKTADRAVVAGTTELVRLPKAGRTTKVVEATGDTTVSSGQPNTNLNVINELGNQYWDMVGNDSTYYGDVRTLMAFDDWGIPATAQVESAHLRMWQSITETTNGSATYDVQALTRTFDQTQATWNRASSATTWTTPGGDLGGTVYDDLTGFGEGPERMAWDVKPLVQQWVSNPTGFKGLVLKTHDETVAQEHTLFASLEVADNGGLERSGPRIAITYIDQTPESTFYVPQTPSRMVPGSAQTVDVTLTNTTTSTWTVAGQALTYSWSLPDGTAVGGTIPTTALPQDMSPGETRTVPVQVSAPALSGVSSGNKRADLSLTWRVVDKAAPMQAGLAPSAGGQGTGTSPASLYFGIAALPAGGLKQNVAVEDPTSDQLGLESFYTYAGKNTGAGSTIMNNVAAGNAVWSYDAFSNPGRGLSTFARFAYNSQDTSDTVSGFGWSAQISGPIRLGAPLDFHPNPRPTEVFLPDGDGTTHVFRLDATTGSWIAPAGVNYKLTAADGLDCTPGKDEQPRAWTLLRPDGTRFFFGCDGYMTATVDKNGNTQTFTYAERNSNNQPRKFLQYVTDPAGRQTLTVDYWEKGQTGYQYINAAGQVTTATGKLSNSKIYDHVKSMTDVSGRRIDFFYTEQGLLGRMVDGANDTALAKTFAFTYDAVQGNKNVKLVQVTDPRGNATDLSYFYPSEGDDPKDHWAVQTITDRLDGVTTFDYVPHATTDDWWNTTVTDAKGNNTTYVSDDFGRPRSVTNAKNETVTLTWDGDNNVRTLTEANGAVTAYCYDPKTGFPIWQRDAEQNAAHGGAPGTSECVPGETATQAPPGAAVYEYATRADGYAADIFRTTSPAGRMNQFSYDQYGNLLTVTDGRGLATATEGDYTTSYTYDQYGQLLTATDANGNTTEHRQYTPVGYPEITEDALGNIATTTYDVRGQVTQAADPLDGLVTQTYDVYGRPLVGTVRKSATETITSPAPAYDANDNVTVSTAPNGAVSTAVYDATDQITSASGPKDTPTSGDRISTYAYDNVGNLLKSVEPKGTATTSNPDDYTTSYFYDEIYQSIAVKNAVGDQIEYEYDNVGNVVEVRDPKKVASPNLDDYTSKTEYDRNHRPVAGIDAAGNRSTTTYDADGLTLSATDPLGSTSYVTYDERGAQVETKAPHSGTGGATVFRTTQFEYDEVGNTTRVITPRGVATANVDDFAIRTEYDALNRPVRSYQPYDPAHTRYNDPNVYTETTYDAAGRVTATSLPPSEGQTIRNTSGVEYFANGWVKKSTDPWGIATTYEYDALGQQTARTLTSADGSTNRTMTWSYFPDGKLAATADDGVPVGSNIAMADNTDSQQANPTGTWGTGNITGQQGYDHRTHIAATSTADKFTWNLDVPADGAYDLYVTYPQVSSAASDAPFTFTHGETGAETAEPVARVDQRRGGGAWHKVGTYTLSAGEPTRVELAPTGTGVVVADAVRLVRDNTADADTEQKTFTYAYDVNGNLISIADDSSGTGAADAYTIAYDGLNQVSSVTEALAGQTTATTGYAHDANGLPTTVNHPKQSSAYTYDLRDLVDTVTVDDLTDTAAGKTTRYTYTVRGQQETETKANGNLATYTYFNDGALKSLQEKDGTTLVSSHEYTYDPNGNQATDAASKQNADNAAAYLNSTTTYAYDPADRLTAKVKAGNGASVETYVHDDNANVISQSVGGTTTSYTYDRNRLLSAALGGTSAAYHYDPFGRQKSTTSVGQVIARTTYDGFDHVVKSEQMNDAGQLEATTYTFDPLDRTTSTTTGGKTTDYTYLGMSSEVLTEQVAGQLTKSYQYSPWGQRLSQVTHEGTSTETAYYGYNAHTDVETLTDDTGKVTATYGYTAYGSDDTSEFTGIDKPDPGDPAPNEPYNAYRYNSKRWDASSGTYDMGFRDYSPGLNRFTTRDMYNGALADVGLGADPYSGNRYAFTAGNPISRIEADGHDWLSDAGNWVADFGSSLLDQAVAGLEGTADWAIQWGTGFVGCLKEDQATCDQAVAAGDQMSLENQWAGLKSDVSGIQAGYESGSSAVATASAVLLVGDFASRKPRPKTPDASPEGGVALGLRNHGLREFAEKNGLTHFLDVEEWKSKVHEAVNYSGEQLHIMLDGFHGGTPSEKFQLAYENGIGDNWFATEWEMGIVGRSLRVETRDWSSISFYLDGSPVQFDMPTLRKPGS
ncbi:DNRLRE domain-containing protein [Antribacter gilvus]|uniref:golvesin C-terminal-like domain-containing protein n=1 Tax=Antribacter gilvus TaxID=2304675 RepID=UPI000F78A916|nr:DNRLRE domain-containing protein [Antribacter gilvus]